MRHTLADPGGAGAISADVAAGASLVATAVALKDGSHDACSIAPFILY